MEIKAECIILSLKEALEEVQVNLRSITFTGDKEIDSYVDDSIKIITEALKEYKSC